MDRQDRAAVQGGALNAARAGRPGRSSLLADLPANVVAGADHDGPPRRADYLRTIPTARFLAAFLHRCAAAIPIGALAALVKQVNQAVTGADISPSATIGSGLVLYHPNGVVIGSGVVIGTDAVLQQGVTVGGAGGPRRNGVQRTLIGDRVFLGAGARVIGEVEVGDDVIVGANAVVTKSVPRNSVAVGIPATARPRG